MKARPHQPFLRQLGFFDPFVHQPHVVIVGAGGIGSPTTLFLTRLGIRYLTVFDMDVVERHNLSTGFYLPSQIGMPKVKALGELVHQFGYEWTEYTGVNLQFTRNARLSRSADIIISGVDSVEGRQEILAYAIVNNVPLFIDGRIGGELIKIYSVKPSSKKECQAYFKTLPKPNEITEIPCVMQQVGWIGAIMAGLLTRAVGKWVTLKKYEREVIVKTEPLALMVSDRVDSSRKHRSRNYSYDKEVGSPLAEPRPTKSAHRVRKMKSSSNDGPRRHEHGLVPETPVAVQRSTRKRRQEMQ